MTTGHEIAMGLRSAYLSMHRQTTADLADSGVTAHQFVLLALLCERDDVTQQDLVARASSDPNTVRAMLVLLEDRGFVARRPHPADRRARRVLLTPTGRAACDRLTAAVRPLQHQLAGIFEPDEAAAFVQSLNRVTAAMAEWEQNHSRCTRSAAR